MQRISLRLIPAIIAVFSFFNWSCNKVDTTTLGADLIPAVDNVHTFADTLLIETTQALFTDSTKMGASDTYVLGSITNDAVFGKTNSNVYLELKPPFYSYSFGNEGDTLEFIDSVYLCLSYKGFFGDKAFPTPQHFKVYQLDDNTDNFVGGTAYKLDFQPNPLPSSAPIGEAYIDPSHLGDTVYFNHNKDSVTNQIRIKLSDAFAAKLKGMDSSSSGNNNAFYSDSTFRQFFKGFAIEADKTMGNGLCYVNFTEAETRLEIHYRTSKANKKDTSYASFSYYSAAISTSSPASAHANYLNRDRSGSEMQDHPNPNNLYLQVTPGNYANLSIPMLESKYSHMGDSFIIHRAEIIVEQDPENDPSAEVFTPPPYLYIDLIDTGSNAGKFKPVYYSLTESEGYDPDNGISFFPNATGINFNYFGGYLRYKVLNGKQIAYYSFNVSRYVQNMVTHQKSYYDFRLYAPFELNYNGYVLPFYNSLSYGRIKIGSGTNPDYKLRMRIVYSKI